MTDLENTGAKITKEVVKTERTDTGVTETRRDLTTMKDIITETKTETGRRGLE